MNTLDHRLTRLLRAAAGLLPPGPPELEDPPFGFESRVLAVLFATGWTGRAAAFNAVFGRACACAAALLCLSLVFSYRALADLTTAFDDPAAPAVRLVGSAAQASLELPR